VINYRQQGVADKIVKAHSTVLAKRIKYRVRSEKCSGWIGPKESNSYRGFPADVHRHKKT
jgi:hypothetical protein